MTLMNSGLRYVVRQLFGWSIASFSNYTIDESTIAASYWTDYQGVFRANTLLSKLPDVNMEEETKEDLPLKPRC